MSKSFLSFVISLLTAVGLYAEEQKSFLPMFEEGKIWEYTEIDLINFHAPKYIVISVEGDTVVDNQQAVRLRVHQTYPKEIDDRYITAYQQEGMIYLFFDDYMAFEKYNEFGPLMNFDVEPGDSLCSWLTVADVRPIEIGGEFRRCITFKMRDPKNYWLEGIGTSTDHLFLSLSGYTGGRPDLRLQRCSIDGNCIFTALDLGGELIFEDVGLFYSTTNGSTASLTSFDMEELNDVTVAATVTSHDISYTVTEIGPRVFFGTQVSKVTLPETITSVGYYSFTYAWSLTSLTVKAVVPPTVVDETFDPVTCAWCTLYVPDESVDAYAEAEGWNMFERILPISSALSDAATDCCGAVRGEVYGTDGSLLRRIERPEGGLTAGECCSGLPAGIYTVRLTDASGHTTTVKAVVR